MSWRARAAARTLAVAGLALAAGTTLLAGGFTPSVLGFVLWAAVPYALILALSRVLANGWAVVTGAAAVLVGEAYIRAEVFLFPRGSTAALALIFSPLYLSLVALPAGLALGWLAGWLWSRARIVGRAALAAGLAGVVWWAWWRTSGPRSCPARPRAWCRRGSASGRPASCTARAPSPRLVSPRGRPGTRWGRSTAPAT